MVTLLVHSISFRAGACTLAVYVPEFSSRTSPRLGRMHRHQSSPSVMASSSRQMEHRYKSYVVGSQHLFEQAPAYWPSMFEISSRASPPAAEHYYLNPPSVILSSWKHWTLPLPRDSQRLCSIAAYENTHRLAAHRLSCLLSRNDLEQWW